MQLKELTKRKIRKEVDRLMLANSKAQHPHEKVEITKALLGRILGGCTTSIRKNMDAWKAELEAHHALYDIKPGHNFAVANYLRHHTPAEPARQLVEASNKALVAEIQKWAFRGLTLWQFRRNQLNGGDIVAMRVFKNRFHKILEIDIAGSRKSTIRTVRKTEKTTAYEAEFMGEVAEITLTWQKRGGPTCSLT